MKRAIISLVFICIISLPLILAFLPMEAAGAGPDVTLYKQSNKTNVTVGDTLLYTIFFENLGPQISTRIWINDTLPSGVTYVNDTAYTLGGIFKSSILTTPTLRLEFYNASAGNYSFNVTTTVLPNVNDGDILTNIAVMNYTSNSGKLQPTVTSFLNVTVSMPVFDIDKTYTIDPVDPTLVTYTVNVSNIGSAEAMHTWLNDSLPAGMNLLSFQESPGLTCASPPGWIRCTRDNFAAGTETLNISMKITPAVPADSKVFNWIYLNYTNQYGLMMPMLSTNANFTAQTAQIDIEKIVDQRMAAPGSNIHYYIYYNNTGTLNATDIWINDTLPNDVLVIHSSSPPVENVTGRIRWYFTDVEPGSYAVNIEIFISTSLPNGAMLTNQVTADYFDIIGRRKPRSTSNASTEVVVDIPNIRVVKTANVQTIQPGGQILYAIYYNNTGNTYASRVTVEDTTPIGTQILAANPYYTSRSGNHYFWVIQNVIPGIHAISVTLMVDTGVSIGTDLINTVTLTYTDSSGRSIGGNFDSVIVGVRLPPPPPNGGGGIPAWLAAAFVVATIVIIIGGLLYIKRGTATYIDDVFLLHRDGLLIKHFARRLNPDVDSDILGGMLIAVQNFVNESFASDRGLAREGGLDELKFGKYSVMLTRGKSIVLAAVISGTATAEINKKIRVVVERIEKAYGRVLEKWSGDMAQVTGVERYLKDLTSAKYQEKVKKKKPAS